ncbi:TBC domain protein [Trichuris suis]|nr:TBC domain protein [Trichuris suis]
MIQYWQETRVVFDQNVWLSMEAVENPVQGRLRFFQKLSIFFFARSVPCQDQTNRQWFIGWSAEVHPSRTTAYGTAQVADCGESARTNSIAHHELQLDAMMAMKCNESEEHGDVISFQFLTRSATLPLFYLTSKEYDKFMDCLRQRVMLKRYTDANCYLFDERQLSAAGETEQKDVYLIFEKAPAWSKEAALLKEENAADWVTKFKINPYTTTMTSLAKFKDFLTDFASPTRLFDMRDYETDMQSLAQLQKRDPVDAISIQVDNDFQLVDTTLKLPPRKILARSRPLSEQQWRNCKNEDGSIINPSEVKQTIFKGGIQHELRKEVWKYLLGCYDWSWPQSKCIEKQKELVESYHILKTQWKSVTADQESRWSDHRKFRDIIEKDVIRTDRNHEFFQGDDNENLTLLHDVLMTYMMYNFDLGTCIQYSSSYVQGMSDLLSPLVYIFGDEVDSFWAFVGFMNRCERNFYSDQLSIKTQLKQLKCLLEVVDPELSDYFHRNGSQNMFFCFRWILILFKREFSFEDIFLLWEVMQTETKKVTLQTIFCATQVLWTDCIDTNFHLLICLAILETQKDYVLAQRFGFSDILKHVNSLSMNINVHEVLAIAEGIYHQLAAVQNELPQEIASILSFNLSY